MTEEQILKAFNNRWRIKGFDEFEVRQLSGKSVKDMCLDFFRTGIFIVEGSVVGDVQTDTIQIEDADFAIFWSLYDKKVGKPKAEKLWSKLSKNEKEACLAYIPLYKQAQPDKQFRKNPETFLRNKSWNDEIIQQNNPYQQARQRLNDAAELIAGYAKKN